MGLPCGSLVRHRIQLAEDLLHHCAICERRCGVNRLAGEKGYCQLGAEARCFKRHISFSEEVELLPSYMVYLSGCNLRCRFCIQAPVSLDAQSGELIELPAFADAIRAAAARGARTINLVGGEPGLHPLTLLKLAAELGLAAREGGEQGSPPLAVCLPKGAPTLVFNTNLYLSSETIDLLDGVCSIYLADFKFGNDRCAEGLADASRYTETLHRNLLAVSERGRLIVRHLLLPGHVECCFKPIVSWMARHLPHVPLHVMGTYVQGWRSDEDDHLRRLVTADERSEAAAWLDKIGLIPYGG